MSLTNPSPVSIIVRTMGRPQLERALASLIAQSYPAVEIVLVIANPIWQPNFSLPPQENVIVVAPGRHLPRPDAANAGLAAANGSWIGFLDEDDWVESDHVEQLVGAMSSLSSSTSRVIYGDIIVHEADREYVRSVGYWKRKHTYNPIPHINSFLIASSLYKVDGCHFDPDFDLLEDWDFFVQCAEHSDFFHVKNASGHYASDLGNSGGGFGANRDETRLKPYIDKMSNKWGTRYAEIIMAADKALSDGRLAYARGDWKSVEKWAHFGLDVDPGNPYLLNLLANYFWQSGEFEKALSTLRRACDSAPDNFTLHFDLAALEHHRGDVAAAMKTVTRAKELCSNSEQITRVDALAMKVGLPSSSQQAISGTTI